MDLDKVLSELREELASVDAAILSLEQLQQMSGTKHHRRKPTVRDEAPDAAQLADGEA
jgi:hypothetical protein